jgi:uncharacterized protein (DUF983 family)
MKTCPQCGEKSISVLRCLISSKHFPAECPACGVRCYAERTAAYATSAFLGTAAIFAGIIIAVFFDFWIAIFVFWLSFVIERPFHLIGPMKVNRDAGPLQPRFDPLQLIWHAGLAAATIWAFSISLRSSAGTEQDADDQLPARAELKAE